MTKVDRDAETLKAAFGWIDRQAEGRLSVEEADDFALWLAADTAHADAYARLNSAWRSPAVWTALTRRAVRRDTGSRAPWRSLTATACAAAAGLAILALWPPPAPAPATSAQTFATAPGQLLTAELLDGSRLDLNGRTRLAVDFDAEARAITLEDGEVSVAVATEARPLVVRAGPVSATALGTVFNVDRRGDAVEVAVLEGRVRVAYGAATALDVSAGETVLVDEGAVRRGVGAAGAAAWRTGALDTDGMRLSDVVLELSRATDRPIRLDPSIQSYEVVGRFSLTEPERTLRLIARVYGLDYIEDGEVLTLSPRA